MARVNLGEFEELVLLVVAVLHGDAYGVSVLEELNAQTGRTVNISAIHAALRRLQEKGFVTSDWSESTTARGGRRKRLFTVTKAGMASLEQVRDTRISLWNRIPGISTNFNFG